MKEANKEQKPESHDSPLLDDQLEKLQLKIESVQIPKIPESILQESTAAVLTEHQKQQKLDRQEDFSASTQAAFSKTERNPGKERKENVNEAGKEKAAFAEDKENHPVFISGTLQRMKNLTGKMSHKVLALQAAAFALVIAGAWSLSLILNENFSSGMQSLISQVAFGYAVSAGCLLSLICLMDRLHAMAYGMQELEDACPYGPKAQMKERIVLIALAGIAGLGLCSLLLQGALSFDLVFWGGSFTFLLTMLLALMMDGKLSGILGSSLVSLIFFLIADFRINIPDLQGSLQLIQAGSILLFVMIMLLMKNRKKESRI